MIRVLTLIITLWSNCVLADTLKLAVTTSFHNSGLSEILLPAIKQDTGVDVQLLVVGTGQALRLGKSGDVDAILVHSKPAEEAFVAEGFAPYRREIMYNDFVFIGPAHDPANLHNATSAAQAMQFLATTQYPFVSRGDQSGTHKTELALWANAALDPDSFAPWYASVGSGMGASLNTAKGLNAYILSDRASWLNFANKGTLKLLYSGDPALFNQYAYLPVSTDRHPHVKGDLAQTLETWLTSEKAASLINAYTINDQALFVFNATH